MRRKSCGNIKEKLTVRPIAILHENLPKFNPRRIVDVKNGDGGSPGLSATHEDRAEPFEVTLPQLPTGIEEANDMVR